MVSGASGAARSQEAQSWKGPNTIGTRERAWQKRQKTRRDMQRLQRRTRRSASTIGGAAPDSTIGRAAADRAGARPYRYALRKTRRNVPLHQGFSAEMQSIRPHSGSNPRVLCLTNVYFGQSDRCGLVGLRFRAWLPLCEFPADLTILKS